MPRTLTGSLNALGMGALSAGLIVAAVAVAAGGDEIHATRAFSGAKVNGGTVTHEHKDGVDVLTLSDDFQAPDTPDPHWQVVDTKGRAYVLDRLVLKGDRLNRTIKVPPFVPDIARVQIWCAWAEAVLGEAPFVSPIP